MNQNPQNTFTSNRPAATSPILQALGYQQQPTINGMYGQSTGQVAQPYRGVGNNYGYTPQGSSAPQMGAFQSKAVEGHENYGGSGFENQAQLNNYNQLQPLYQQFQQTGDPGIQQQINAVSLQQAKAINPNYQPAPQANLAQIGQQQGAAQQAQIAQSFAQTQQHNAASSALANRYGGQSNLIAKRGYGAFGTPGTSYSESGR